MKLLDRIKELRNNQWYSPFYTLQRRLAKHRNRNQVIPFDDLVDGIYRMFTGRLDRPSQWDYAPVTIDIKAEETLIPGYRSPDVEIPLKRKPNGESRNHIGIFSILFSPLDVAESALRGNMARTTSTRTKLTLSTFPLWGLINLSRALFGLVGVTISLIPVAIFYAVENARIKKQIQTQSAVQLTELRNNNIINIIEDLNKPHNQTKIQTNQSYWVIKECDKEVKVKVKTKPVQKSGNYDGIFASNLEYNDFANRLENTVGKKFNVTIQPQIADSHLAKASLFKATYDRAPAKTDQKNKTSYNRKFIYIPTARPN